MANGDEFIKREDHAALLDKLVECDWIYEWGFHNDNFAIRWTPKGKERAKLVRELATELKLKPNEFLLLMATCMLQKDTNQ